MDKISPEQRSANMRAIRSKGMKPEMLVRKMLHAMGYRYRLHRSDLPGKPDLVFPSQRKVIFVHGCFWHQHNDPACRFAHTPRSNKDYWVPKLKRNKDRDQKNLAMLEKMGWQALVVWECQTKNQNDLARRIMSFLES